MFHKNKFLMDLHLCASGAKSLSLMGHSMSKVRGKTVTSKIVFFYENEEEEKMISTVFGINFATPSATYSSLLTPPISTVSWFTKTR